MTKPLISGHLRSSFLLAGRRYDVIPFFRGLLKTLGKASMRKDGTAFSYWVPALDGKLCESTPAVLEWNYSEFLQYSIHLDVCEIKRFCPLLDLSHVLKCTFAVLS